jgi:hypothetical protein
VNRGCLKGAATAPTPQTAAEVVEQALYDLGYTGSLSSDAHTVLDRLIEAGHMPLPGTGREACGDVEYDADDERLVCDLPKGHDGTHGAVVVQESRISWLSAPARESS